MRRGRIFIYLALIVIIAVGAIALYLSTRRTPTPQPTTETLATAQSRYVEIVTAGQNIYPGTPITEDMLSSIQIPEENLAVGLYINKADVVNMYAKYAITQGVPITESMVTVTPGNVNLPGSDWAPYIPQGLTAVSIPITRLSAAAYGIRDGDYVNVIVSMLLVDVDPANQSALPNYTAAVNSPGLSDQGNLLTAQITSGGEGSRLGRAELDEALAQPLYLVPSESQRPRLVTQMIMQKIQVLHVGSFPLPGEVVSDQSIASVGNLAATATPVPANEQVTTVVVKPDIVTLMVTPQDAVMLTYLVYSGAEVTLTLRNPNDQNPTQQPDAATLEYLLTQYNIPVPPKLPYSMQPRLDALVEPELPNDAIPQP
jgi:Flp pilus assembly protein CpaB